MNRNHESACPVRWGTGVALIALAVALGACGDRDVPPSQAVPSAAVSASAMIRGPATCREIEATSLPADLRLVDRTLVPAGADPAGVRVQYLGATARELTLLSGIAGEIPRGSTDEQATVRGHPASLSSPSAGIFVARWLEAGEGMPCGQYAVVASRLSRPEMDAVLAGIK
jgi:hypothetical protein